MPARAPRSLWRFPTVATALAGAVFAHRLYTVQSKGGQTRAVDWCQSSALLVRCEAAAQIGYMDPDFFVYSDEVDFARRLRDAGWRSLYVPGARAIHHEQLSTGIVPERRIVEMARNRDLYMRKHHSLAAARAVRWLTAWSYAVRALVALMLPGHMGGRDANRYWRHVTATLRPDCGEGMREAAAAYNRAGAGAGGARTRARSRVEVPLGASTLSSLLCDPEAPLRWRWHSLNRCELSTADIDGRLERP